MTLTLDATPSGLTANSFIDLPTAQAIMDATPNATAWATGSLLQSQALIHATAMLSTLAYRGFKTHVAQALAWPRASVIDPDYGDTDGAYSGYMVNGFWGVYLDINTIPVRVQRATAMLALEVLRAGTADVWGIDKSANVAKKQIDVITTEYVPVGERRFGLRVYPTVWREVFPLTLASDAVSVSRA